MFYQTESKAQVWRALVVFENRSEMLLFVGRSSEQVRANVESAFNDLLDDEEKLKAQSISLQRWHGAPDAGRWMHQTNLTKLLDFLYLLLKSPGRHRGFFLLNPCQTIIFPYNNATVLTFELYSFMALSHESYSLQMRLTNAHG